MRRAKSACSEPGCPAFSCDEDRCIKKRQGTHKPATEPDSTGRGNYSRDKAYATTRWRKVRLAQLGREPLCQRCLSFDITTIANTADHVNPHRGDIRLMWDSSNLQSLCTSCHTVKTNNEKQEIFLDFREWSSHK